MAHHKINQAKENHMPSEIQISVHHKIRKVLEVKGRHGLEDGTTTIEAETTPDGEVLLYVQNKGFGFSPKSVKTRLDDSTVRDLIEFFGKHLELSDKLAKMRASCE
jgi:hypothetical protein